MRLITAAFVSLEMIMGTASPDLARANPVQVANPNPGLSTRVATDKRRRQWPLELT